MSKEEKNEIIDNCLNGKFTHGLYKASLQHFYETGKASGTFYTTLCEMLEVAYLKGNKQTTTNDHE